MNNYTIEESSEILSNISEIDSNKCLSLLKKFDYYLDDFVPMDLVNHLNELANDYPITIKRLLNYGKRIYTNDFEVFKNGFSYIAKKEAGFNFN